MIAIYTRQSVDKRDSISIETQIKDCMKEISSANTEKVEVYTDRVSGKSTENRPDFKRMMTEVRNGNISKIIVYKVDRISRRLLDFAIMREEFEKYNVEFIAHHDKFDTSTPMGRAMLDITMTFAQMEREIIQQRVTDNYYERGARGFYLGGYAPFGYNKIQTSIDGKKTYTFEVNTEESVIVKQMFSDYFNGSSIGDIARYLNNNKITSRKNRPWGNPSLARILRNPVYVKANADVYNYLAGLGAKMNNTVEEYVGTNGCVVYGKVKDRKSIKFADLSTDNVTLGLHEGIIEPSLWLGVQYTINQKKGHSNLGTGSLTWLQGLVKCKCGYNYYVKRLKGKNKENKYFYCRGRRNDSCQYSRKMIRVDDVEEIVEDRILSYLYDLKDIEPNQTEEDNPELNTLKIQASKIDKEIDTALNLALNSSEITVSYLNNKIEKMEAKTC